MNTLLTNILLTNNILGDDMRAQNEANEIRQKKGMQIGLTCRIMKREKGGYVVPSQTCTGAYLVTYQNYKAICECPDFETKGYSE